LLPQEASRRGIDVAERYMNGAASDGELNMAIWHAENAAFNIGHNCDPEAVEQWADEVQAIPAGELAALLHPPGVALDVDARELLARAAYFTLGTTMFPQPPGLGVGPVTNSLFLSAALLREQFGNPFQGPSGCA
jgi:hypothetical protein